MIKPQSIPDALVQLDRDINSVPVYSHTISELMRWIVIPAEAPENMPARMKALSKKESKLEAAQSYVGAIADGLKDSSIYYCDEEMSDLVYAGALLLDDTDIADASSVPFKEGFCYFDKGIVIHDNTIVHGLVWRALSPEVYVLMSFNDSSNQYDRSSNWQAEKILENTNTAPIFRWGFVSLQFYETGTTLNPTVGMSSEQLSEVYGDKDPETIVLGRLFHSFLLMLQQPPEFIETKIVRSTNKGAIKRAKKNKVVDTVTVLDLRHKRAPSKSSSSGGRASFEYSVRWVVSGHWRWQWYTDKITKQRIQKRIWIHPHFKGQEDKPFAANKVVRALLK